MTHDYKRNGTTTLFAALNILDGTVIGQNMQRHRHQEFIRFLNRIERDIPAGKAIHAIVDNYAAHKHEKVRAWLKRHPRWTIHFTPTSSSWLNAVEGFFAKLTRRRLSTVSFIPSSTFKPRSTVSSLSTMKTMQNLSCGPPIQTKSSQQEIVGSKRWNQSTRVRGRASHLGSRQLAGRKKVKKKHTSTQS